MGWKVWDPISETFVESAHAKWLTEDTLAIVEDVSEATSEPVPNPPSSISKLLNLLECEEKKLLKALFVNYNLDAGLITKCVREKDKIVGEIWKMASGISQELSRS